MAGVPLLLPLILLSGCATGVPGVPVRPPGGLFFANYKAPLTVDQTGNAAGSAAKRVSQSTTWYLHDILITGLDFAWDDAAIARIAQRGGITRISYADYEYLSILGVIQTFTVNVYGN